MDENTGRRGRAGAGRRAFLGRAVAAAGVAAAAQVVPSRVLGRDGQTPPSGRVTLAAIGVGGQGLQNVEIFLQFPDVRVVAVCDVNREGGGYLSWNWGQGKEGRNCGREPARRLVDEYYARENASGAARGCKAYADFRELLEKEDVDAVMVATPDHSHAVITLTALGRRKHVYCEKPLTWSVHEARMVTEAARRAGVATQMGNQGQALEEARVTQEFLLDGVIGAVTEVRAWFGARFWKTALYEDRPSDTPPVPEGLDWDLWLGPAAARPYHPEYHPWLWRNWWEFGTGQIGDLGAHKLSTVFKALKLGAPVAVEASSTRLNAETYPAGILARYEFPARDGMPPVTLTWSDGGLKAERPKDLELDRQVADVIYVGERGTLMGHRLIPETRMKAYGRPPRVLPRSPGHHREWVDACKGGPPAGSNFVDHAGPMTEALMLANVAVRAGKRIEWDAAAFRVKNDAGANDLLRRRYREGWAPAV